MGICLVKEILHLSGGLYNLLPTKVIHLQNLNSKEKFGEC